VARPDVAVPPKVLVIGGGISGLACAWNLQRRGISVLLVERSARFGGVISTVEKNGFRFDVGPQSFTSSGVLAQMIEELGLGGELLPADPHAPRFIFSRGRLVAAPFSPPALLRSPLIGWRTKLRALSEPLRRTRPPADDESIASFVRRKFGPDILTNLVAPAVSGIFAGDVEKLSLCSTFPAVHRMEEQYGSVLRGAMKSGRQRGISANFKRGVVALPEALAGKLGTYAESGVEVATIRRTAAGNSASFDVTVRNSKNEPRQIICSAIVVATPTNDAAALLGSLNPTFAEPLARVPYAGVAQVCSGYALSQIAVPPRGFGFLVPRTEGLRLLGTVFSSFLFPGRAPEKTATFTSFFGGATEPDFCRQPAETISEIARTELAKVLGITGPPLTEYVSRWERALPQYNLGHQRIVAGLHKLCTKTPGVFLAGNYLTGPSVGSCAEQAHVTAEEVARYVAACA
jgi:oxygen-dependent protoporphyrinogen oxidase